MAQDDEFRRMVKDFAAGRVDTIIMHTDTAKLLSPEEWELLKTAGAGAVVVYKSLPEADISQP